MIQNNQDLPWVWEDISEKPNIRLDIIKTYPDLPWNWRYLSCNPNITWKFVKDNIDKPWNWYWLSKNEFNKYNSCIRIQRIYKKYYKNKLNKVIKIQRRWKDKYYLLPSTINKYKTAFTARNPVH